jgi:selenocysteine lyase/cysteine desulfurase
MTETQFDQRRAWLDELLAKRHLWPSQVAVLRMLAQELGVEVTIWDKKADWNYQINEWRRRQEVRGGSE